ncbi:hypothetical protein AGABI1DRAFT_100996 [Agaricus bisporus var. burnettii JB137-S8]|uniref:Uncharacterized protein n=1 Tax=Agaricus bisporus var. burnettii (strain JB137-S8 / ATCC MYA-4627 / FGSC 10392) TaxID=597362 RepID=K5X5L5_AGABU|nr:uncharacterized protein AGABI1DRAFT_100996 [Agaricus bisporus var. burnettii JB137-S8]EKM78232.1 hypothetical protein AGABI1DRAFT_100996 [Agaricus bisporus var. burnettii JB137-S8]
MLIAIVSLHFNGFPYPRLSSRDTETLRREQRFYGPEVSCFTLGDDLFHILSFIIM